MLLSSVTMAQSSGESKLLKGKIEMKQLISDPAFAWFYTGVNKYEVNSNMVNYVKATKEQLQMVVLVNTTEEASKQLLPQFYKVMIMASVPEESVHIYGADDKGNTGNAVADGYKVKKFPTILIMSDGKEEGRIAGIPKQPVEEELAQIIMKINSKKKKEE